MSANDNACQNPEIPADLVLDLTARHNAARMQYEAIDARYEAGEIDAGQFEDEADPVLDQCLALTDQICAAQAATLEGLAAQYRFFVQEMGDSVGEAYNAKWAGILDQMTAGFDSLTAAPAPIAPNETPVLRLYRQHRAILDAAEEHVCTVTGKDEDAEMDRLFFSRSNEIEDEMMALPCTCAADFAAKAVVGTARGGVYYDWETGAIWQEARALIGGGDG